VSDGQLRRYFIGLVSFGFVACWAAAGLLAALGSLAVCAFVVVGPELLSKRRALGIHRPMERSPREMRARSLRDDDHRGDLPLVPDEPSLIIELGAGVRSEAAW